MIECVPNISEGQDTAVVAAIVDAARGDDVIILDVDSGAAANRTVVTMVGEPPAIADAAFRLIAKAAELIDMSQQHGEHPRLGATDVCPFVPLDGASIDDCVQLARAVGQRVGTELEIPVFLYEHAATRPERKRLSHIRRGGFEGLASKLADPDQAPDFGPARVHPRAGACVIGARPFLIAYNINLNTSDRDIARAIAKQLRRDVPACRAIGWYIEEFGCAQVSINLVDYRVTGMHDVFDAVSKLAPSFGASVTGSELVGLVPQQALLAAGQHSAPSLSADGDTDELLQRAVAYLGLDSVRPFATEQKVLEQRLRAVSM